MKKRTVVFIAVVFVLTAGFINSTNKIIKSYGFVKPTGPFRPIRSENDSENLYFTIYDTDTGQVWNENSGTFVDTDDASVTGANYGNIAVTCTDSRDQAEDGWMPILPTALSSVNADFEADLTFYTNATPANTDTVLVGRHCYIKSTTIGGTYKARIYSMDDL